MQKLYNLNEVENQIDFLILMGFNVHITGLKETVDFERLCDMSRDKLGWYFSKALRSQYLSRISQHAVMKMLKNAN